MIHLLKTYAWLLGDAPLFAVALFELISLRSPRPKAPGETQVEEERESKPSGDR